MTSRSLAGPAARGTPIEAVLGHGDLGFSLLLIFPLFLIYEIGVAFSPVMNGVDFVSHNLFALVHYDKTTYLLIHGGLAVAFLVTVWLVRRRHKDRRLNVGLVLAESIVYALTLGTLIVFVMSRLLGISPELAAGGMSGGRLANLLMSIGAGVHEELVFRLGVCAGGAALLRVTGLRHGAAVAAAFVVSSALFSAAHHLGAAGEPWAFHVFVYRMLAGLVFAAIFYFRSLAHATYTHAFYDIYVLVFRG